MRLNNLIAVLQHRRMQTGGKDVDVEIHVGGRRLSLTDDEQIFVGPDPVRPDILFIELAEPLEYGIDGGPLENGDGPGYEEPVRELADFEFGRSLVESV